MPSPRSLAAACLALALLACQSGPQRRSAPPATYPAAYPPASYPAGQYPPYPPQGQAQQYPSTQYPQQPYPQQYPPQQPYPQQPYPQQPYPQQYPPQQPYPQQYPPAGQYPSQPQVRPAPAPPVQQPPQPPAPPVAAPSVPNDPINTLNITWLRQRAQAVLAELRGALPDSARSRVQNIPLVVDDTPSDVNAFAACANGKALMAITDGMLEIIAWLSMAVAHDEVFGTNKTDEYIRFVAKNLAPERPIPRPTGLFTSANAADGRKVQRQHVVFEEQLAFVLAHELAHHHLGHLPCTGSPGPLGSGDLARVLSDRVPLFNQPNEAAADLAGTTNVLEAGARRSGARWTEAGGLLTMRFFLGLEGGVTNLLLAFQHSHPPPALRIPLIQQSANYWRRTGSGVPVPRIGG